MTSRASKADVIVAGHICLDVIPSFPARTAHPERLLTPGRLVEVDAALLSTGGAVSNTGLALQRLGVATRLMGKVGEDLFGRAILDIVRTYDPELARGMIVVPGEDTSYTVVISPPGMDRVFLHCPGANNTFQADDIPYTRLAPARLLHFGYPPLMRRMFADDGGELERVLAQVKAQGLTTSLDMAKPDPESEAGRAAWHRILKRVLPHADLFLPSLDEILYMLDRPRWAVWEAASRKVLANAPADGSWLTDLSDRLLDMGVAVVALKLGHQGLYLRTSNDRARWATVGPSAPSSIDAWLKRELLAPCFQVDVVGTTGSGDCTIAGFLTGWLKGLPPEEVMTGAVAVGACNVEKADAVSGVPAWAQVQERIRSNWPRRGVQLKLPGWRWDADRSIWIGPADAVF